ncbi:MAG TPA: hypothetical protein VMW68_10290 [Methyloceanibacter sp.]|nr:hypothetical protein [Methyloceanibacter sp.]
MAEQLGFVGDSSPETWWDAKFGSDAIDFAIYASFESPQQQAEVLERLRQSARRCGVQELEVESFPERALSGYRPSDGRLHFGYRDGVTSVPVDWEDAGTPGTANIRELVVGYPSDDYPTAPMKAGAWQDFARDGSFAGLTWIHQKAAAFNSFLKEKAAQVAPQMPALHREEWLAAKLMGRWRDGSPLAKFPDAPPPTPQLDNDFDYSSDPLGARTPLVSHIRVANSRDQPMTFPNRVRFPGGPPRLIRRGFSYGPRLDGTVDDGKDRGLVGLFYFARVNEQFYTVLRWIQETGFSPAFRTGKNGLRAQDALMGNRSFPKANTQFSAPKAGEPLALQLADFIRYKGVAVLFAPSIRALAILSAD